MNPYYLTTAIDYANGSPHLGHAYEKVLADVIVQNQKALGVESHFVTGLDEHGQESPTREPRRKDSATRKDVIE